jgi:hypothetical protein
MSRTIHGSAHAAIKHFRKNPAALSVYFVYVSRANTDNVAWPSIRGLARDTGWGADACQKARQWLIDHSALEEKRGYIRPAWRNLPQEERQQRMNLDQSKYFKPTGGIRIDGVVYNVLYAPVGNEGDETLDVRSHRTSTAPDVGPDSTELDSIKSSERDSKNPSDPNGSDASTNPEPQPTRQRSAKQQALDNMIEALVVAFGLDRDKVTGAKWSEFRGAGKELLDVGAKPDDMRPLHTWCKRKVSDFTSYYMSKEYAAFDAARGLKKPQTATYSDDEWEAMIADTLGGKQ